MHTYFPIGLCTLFFCRIPSKNNNIVNFAAIRPLPAYKSFIGHVRTSTWITIMYKLEFWEQIEGAAVRTCYNIALMIWRMYIIIWLIEDAHLKCIDGFRFVVLWGWALFDFTNLLIKFVNICYYFSGKGRWKILHTTSRWIRGEKTSCDNIMFISGCTKDIRQMFIAWKISSHYILV